MFKIKSNSLDSFMGGLKADYNNKFHSNQLNSTGSVTNSVDSCDLPTVNNRHSYSSRSAKNESKQSDSSFPSVESLHTGKMKSKLYPPLPNSFEFVLIVLLLIHQMALSVSFVINTKTVTH